MEQAISDAKQDAAAHLNKTLWFSAGFFFPIGGTLISQWYQPFLPTGRVLGKSAEYIAFYYDTYKVETKKLQFRWSFIRVSRRDSNRIRDHLGFLTNSVAKLKLGRGIHKNWLCSQSSARRTPGRTHPNSRQAKKSVSSAVSKSLMGAALSYAGSVEDLIALIERLKD